MKTFRLARNGAFTALALLAMTACSDDDGDNSLVIDFQSENISFNDQGYWEDCYDTAVKGFEIDGFTFSHQATATEWGGYVYYSWHGFCPSRSRDNTDHTADWSWVENQWGAITGGGLSGADDTYLLGCWSTGEDLTAVPAEPVNAITYGGNVFDPDEIYVTNSAYGYYVMKNGSAYSKVFAAGDWCILHIIGARDGVETGRVDVYLADGEKMLTDWTLIDLDPLGDVDMIYFQMTSSDTGQWGMNNPAYFCLDGLEIDME